ncbi:MAG: hypothetical protein ABL962_10550 [Fimbriimonadaceae bacterium]
MNHDASPRSVCRSALIQSLHRLAPQVPLSAKGYVAEPSQNLIEGVFLSDFEEDLRQGDGNELERKFLAAHSSSALVVNTFGPFKRKPGALPLPPRADFSILGFEKKCPHGLAGRKSPNLDLLVDSPYGVVAIESKCLEYLSRHKAAFAPAYDAEIRDGRRDTSWFREMERLIDEPRRYHWLDAAQLVKHAFGIAHTFPGRQTTLMYLYWEPTNPDKYPIFAEHRAEVARFSASTEGAPPHFVALSYAELWESWDALNEPEWLTTHVGRLRTRYMLQV